MSIKDLQTRSVCKSVSIKGGIPSCMSSIDSQLGVCVCFVEDPQLQVAHRLATRGVCVSFC